MTAAERLAQIRARVEAATEGPWDAVEGATPGMFWVELRHRATICDFPREQGAQEDAEFIAAARTDLPAALAALRAVLAIDSRTLAAALALSYGSHVAPPRGGADHRAAEAVLGVIWDAIEEALS